MTGKRHQRADSNILQVNLAEYLLQLELGSQICSVRELATQFDASVGTISHLLQELESLGAVKIERRGHLGSYLESRSLNVLWDIIENGPMVIAFTIPSNTRFEGLATGIKALIQSKGFEIYLIFIRGSSTRLKALRENRCHAVVLSKLSADEECQKNEEVTISLPPGSWLKGYSIYSRFENPDQQHHLRVGVDPESFDHQMIAEMTFTNPEVEFVKINFSQLHRLFRDGRIDVTIWNNEDERFALEKDLYSFPIPQQTQEKLGGRDLSAAIVTRKSNKILNTILTDIVDVEELIRIQNEVIAGTYLPEY